MFRFKNVGEIPHGVVEQSIGTIPLTKKERDEIAKEERRRMNQKLDLKWVLSEVLRDMRQANRCLVKYEVKQGCFHITVN